MKPERLSGLRCAVCGAADHLVADHMRGIASCVSCGQTALLSDAEIGRAGAGDGCGSGVAGGMPKAPEGRPRGSSAGYSAAESLSPVGAKSSAYTTRETECGCPER